MLTEFKRLVELLDEEIRSQERILELLSKERVSIVELNREQTEQLAEKKLHLVEQAANLEKKRTALLCELTGAAKAPKVSEVIAKCPAIPVKRELQAKSHELKITATRVRELNLNNAVLLRQALGIVSSTLSIIRSSPGSELPTYGESGSLKGTADPAFARKRSLVTEA